MLMPSLVSVSLYSVSPLFPLDVDMRKTDDVADRRLLDEHSGHSADGRDYAGIAPLRAEAGSTDATDQTHQHEPQDVKGPYDDTNRRSVLLNVAGFIIVTEFCENLAYYGLAGRYEKQVNLLSVGSKQVPLLQYSTATV
jgi:hypothetical protein